MKYAELNLGDINAETKLIYAIEEETLSFIYHINNTSIRLITNNADECNNAFAKCLYETITKFFGLTIDAFDALENVTKVFVIDYCKIFFHVSNYQFYNIYESDIILLCLGKEFAVNFVQLSSLRFVQYIYRKNGIKISNVVEDSIVFTLDTFKKELLLEYSKIGIYTQVKQARPDVLKFSNHFKNEVNKFNSGQSLDLRLGYSQISLNARGHLTIRHYDINLDNYYNLHNRPYYKYFKLAEINKSIFTDSLYMSVYNSYLHTKGTSFSFAKEKYQPYYFKNKPEIYSTVIHKKENSLELNGIDSDVLSFDIIDKIYKTIDVRTFAYHGYYYLSLDKQSVNTDSCFENNYNFVIKNEVTVNGSFLSSKSSSVLEKGKPYYNNRYNFNSYSGSLLIGIFFDLQNTKSVIKDIPSDKICVILNKLKFKGFSSSIINTTLFKEVILSIETVLKNGLYAEQSFFTEKIGYKGNNKGIELLNKRIESKVKEGVIYYINTGKLTKLNDLTNCKFVDIREFIFVTNKLKLKDDGYRQSYYDFQCKILKELISENDYKLFLLSLKENSLLFTRRINNQHSSSIKMSKIILDVLKRRGVQGSDIMEDLINDYIENSINIKSPINIRFNSEERLKLLHDEVTKLYEFRTRGTLIVPNTLLVTELIYSLIKKHLIYEYEFIKSDDRLYKEGKQQHHCVYTYKDYISKGTSVILSTVVNEKRITIELSDVLNIKQTKLINNNIPSEDIKVDINRDMMYLRYAVFMTGNLFEKELEYLKNIATGDENEYEKNKIDIKNTELILKNIVLREGFRELSNNDKDFIPTLELMRLFSSESKKIIEYVINSNVVQENEIFIEENGLKSKDGFVYYEWILDGLYTKSYLNTMKKKNKKILTEKQKETLIYNNVVSRMYKNKNKRKVIPQRGLALPSSGVVLTDNYNYNRDEDFPF